MSVLPWLVLLAPLASAVIIALFTRRAHSLSAVISVVAVLISFICSCTVFAKPEISATEIPWIEIRGFLRVPIGFTLDSLSKTMLVLVSGVGALIHIYSLGYMRDDRGKSRYFASLSLFMFSMLGIVLAGNFVMMFVFWELVGVYMLVRVGFLVQASPDALCVIAWIGTITAVIAALIATQQDDIKRILAYSTLSQLGYMIMAVGLASGEAAMFHLFTHAFFKALLFLGAGSVLVALHHEQDIWKMGGQARNLFLTFVTFGIGMLALIGCPPFAGFFSKDAILSLAYNRNSSIFLLALLTAFLTAFYMMRLFVVVFFGKPRSPAARTSREAPTSMLVPLVVLAVLALIGGFNFVARHFVTVPHERDSAQFVPGLALVAMLLGATGAVFLYRGREFDPFSFTVLRKKFYFDEFYQALINSTQEFLARIAAFIDRWVIDATVVRGSSGATWSFGALLRLMQVGNLQAYAFIFGLGIVWIIYFALFR